MLSRNIILSLKRGLQKANFAEGSLKTIKRRLFIFMRSNLLSQWDRYIAEVVKRINETPQEAIGFMAPIDCRDGFSGMAFYANLVQGARDAVSLLFFPFPVVHL